MDKIIDIDSLPTIGDEMCRTCRFHIGKVIGCISVCVIVAIILSIVLTPSAALNPCISYTPTTLASQVSIACLQWLWTFNKCVNPPSFPPNDYHGWWNQSPSGTTQVSCAQSVPCGAGSYGVILTYIQLCNSYYSG